MSFNTPKTVRCVPTSKFDAICFQEAIKAATSQINDNPKPTARLNSPARFEPKPLAPRLIGRSLRTRFAPNPYKKASSELSLQLMKYKEGKSFQYSPFDSPLKRFLSKKDDDCICVYAVITPVPYLSHFKPDISHQTKSQSLVETLRDWWKFR